MEQQIQIKADDQTLKGAYANLAVVNHTKEEFAIDFISVLPPQGIMLSRIFTSPGHAKRLAKALDDNIKIYEKQFGKIDVAEEPGKSIGFTS